MGRNAATLLRRSSLAKGVASVGSMAKPSPCANSRTAAIIGEFCGPTSKTKPSNCFVASVLIMSVISVSPADKPINTRSGGLASRISARSSAFGHSQTMKPNSSKAVPRNARMCCFASTMQTLGTTQRRLNIGRAAASAL